MTTPIEVLDQIREGRGKDRINPHVIEGFGGPGDLPSPPPPAEMPAQDPNIPDAWLHPENDEPEQTGPPPLPPGLVPHTRPRSATPAPAPQPATTDLKLEFSSFQLLVFDKVAAWKGRAIDLTEDDQMEVRRVVLRAIQREVDRDLAAAGVRRRRRRRVRVGGPEPAPEPATARPRKRGRPRGSLLAPRIP